MEVITIDSDSEDETAVLIESSDSETEFGQDTSLVESKSEEFVAKNFEQLAPKNLVQLMQKQISEVHSVIGLPKPTIRNLLNFLRWDTEKFYEKFYDNKNALFKAAKVSNPAKRKHRAIIDSDAAACEICLLDEDLLPLECGHQFCKPCWIEYLTTKIKDDGQAESISCAGHQCELLLEDKMILKLLPNPAMKKKYQQLISNNFVMSNRLIRFCPAPRCVNAVKVQITTNAFVKCKCGFWFCFECSEESHEPIPCELVTQWAKLIKSDDPASKNWIARNTRPCPQCKTSIQKNGGCNTMNCSKCHLTFCWACMGSYDNHSGSCNVFGNTRDDNNNDSASLDTRFEFYNHRYRLMLDSLKFEKKMYAPRKVAKMVEIKDHWMRTNFIKDAVDVLIQCRLALAYSYIFAYFMQKTNQLLIFEQNLENLRVATEGLSETLENKISPENINEMKQKIVNSSIFCDNRRKNLVDFIKDGYENSIWRQRCATVDGKATTILSRLLRTFK